MSEPGVLSDRAKQVLRLVREGYDAKSIASQLGLSVHTVNEYLRDARRALSVTSSREAARKLAAIENAPPENAVYTPIGGDAPSATASHPQRQWLWSSIMFLAALSGAAALLVSLADRSAVAQGAARVVATSPAPGASVPAGALTVTVTFDRPMRPGGWSFVQLGRDDYPACATTPRQSRDRRSFALDCRVESGRRYRMGFNSGRFVNFRDDFGEPARSAVLEFDAR